MIVLYSLMLIIFAYYVKLKCDDIDSRIDNLEELINSYEVKENEIGVD